MMTGLIDKPVFLDAGTANARFRYERPNALTLQVLKCVRVVSALDAAVILLTRGHTTEVGVLFRTIDDFLADIMFVDEAVTTGNANAAQQQFLDKYFVDEAMINHNERRQKVQASEARTIGGDNPHRIKEIVSKVDDAFSGIVHGSYQSVMEMFGSGGRFVEYRHHLGLYVHRSLNIFCKVAYNLGHEELSFMLRELRREFEASLAYTQR
jgi:hypothetical protein